MRCWDPPLLPPLIPRGSCPPPRNWLSRTLPWVPRPGIEFGLGLADPGEAQPVQRVPTLALFRPRPVPTHLSAGITALDPRPALSVGGRHGGCWDGDEGRLSQRPPLWSSPQNARLSTARPVSATTSAPSVRRACTCTRAAATQPAPRAPQLPTAPWSAAVLVRRVGTAGRGSRTPGGGQARESVAGALSRESSPQTTLWGFSQDSPALWA